MYNDCAWIVAYLGHISLLQVSVTWERHSLLLIPSLHRHLAHSFAQPPPHLVRFVSPALYEGYGWDHKEITWLIMRPTCAPTVLLNTRSALSAQVDEPGLESTITVGFRATVTFCRPRRSIALTMTRATCIAARSWLHLRYHSFDEDDGLVKTDRG